MSIFLIQPSRQISATLCSKYQRKICAVLFALEQKKEEKHTYNCVIVSFRSMAHGFIVQVCSVGLPSVFILFPRVCFILLVCCLSSCFVCFRLASSSLSCTFFPRFVFCSASLSLSFSLSFSFSVSLWISVFCLRIFLSVSLSLCVDELADTFLGVFSVHLIPQCSEEVLARILFVPSGDS